MRYINILLVSLFTFLLSACSGSTGELDYSDFNDHLVSNFAAIENREEERYIAYYYGEFCGHCKTIKSDILEFFDDLEEVPFYILETSGANDSSKFKEYLGTPTIMVMIGGEPSEVYPGVDLIEDFIEKYKDFDVNDLEYDFFEDQHLNTYEEALSIDSEAYIIYYYLDNCPYCVKTKPDFLRWAFDRAVDDIYFMNGAEVDTPDQIPTELIVLNSGTPILVIMKNGKFANEFYSGEEEVKAYIKDIGDKEITTDHYTE